MLVSQGNSPPTPEHLPSCTQRISVHTHAHTHMHIHIHTGCSLAGAPLGP